MMEVVAGMVCVALVLALSWALRSAATARGAVARAAGLEAEQCELLAKVAARDQAIGELREARAGTAAEQNGLREQVTGLRGELAAERDARGKLVAEQQKLAADLASASTALRKEREGGAEKLALLQDAREQMGHQFRTLANDILEEKSKHFTEQNKVNLGHLLDPLKTQLTDFKGTVERVYIEEGKERIALAEQVKQLHALNAQLSTDAIGLTNALKGSNKTQGNWGEMVLERILETGGLRKGHEYRVQESYRREDGSRVVPDVILHLPEGRHLVVDAKVSLVDYNEHVNGLSEMERERSAMGHVSSIRTHIKGLSEKDYRSLHSLHTVDFVIMFVPIEPAFMLAIGRDAELWQHAWEKSILLVSPSTLLFVVRTVAHLWNQEQQRDNVKEVMRQGGLLYEKFASFVADLDALGEQLKKAQKAYDAASNKLSTGKGNLVNSSQRLYKLGVPAKKRLEEQRVRAAAESAGDFENLPLEGEADGPVLVDLAAAGDEASS